MPRKRIATLTGRQLELVGAAGDRLVKALREIALAQNRGLELEKNLQDALEIATGDKDPSTLSLDRQTGEVFREVEARKRAPRGATTKKRRGKK